MAAIVETIWVQRLNESLVLLDKEVGRECECEPDWKHGEMCIQCHARKVQRWIRDGKAPEEMVEDAFEQVICHLNDMVELPIDSEHECVRYWASLG